MHIVTQLIGENSNMKKHSEPEFAGDFFLELDTHSTAKAWTAKSCNWIWILFVSNCQDLEYQVLELKLMSKFTCQGLECQVLQ